MPSSLRPRFASLLAVVATAAIAAHPTAWPTGPVKIVVPYAPGSTPDIAARLVAEKLAPRLHQPVVVENRPGASGNLGIDAVVRARPDGHTIGLGIAGPLGVNALLYPSMPYDPARDLAFITIAASQPSVLVASPKLAVRDAASVVDLLRENPGRFNYASMGAGSISHLAMEALASKSGSLVHVPYAGSGPAVLAVLSGDVELACLPATAVLPHIKSGRLKALAVATAKRSPLFPDLPTLGEVGLAGVQADAWMGFVAPAKTPPATVQRLHDEIVAVLVTPEVRERLRTQAMEVVASSPAEFRATVEADLARWRPVIVGNHIRLD